MGAVVVRERSRFEWDVVEEGTIREGDKVLTTCDSAGAADAYVKQYNARQAQSAMGSYGMSRAGVTTRVPGCTCPVGGMMLEAIPCPVHDV